MWTSVVLCRSCNEVPPPLRQCQEGRDRLTFFGVKEFLLARPHKGKACFYKSSRTRRRKEAAPKCWKESHVSVRSQWAPIETSQQTQLIGMPKDAIHLETEHVNWRLLRGSWSDEKYRFGMIELQPVWGLHMCMGLCVHACMGCVCVYTLADRMGGLR